MIQVINDSQVRTTCVKCGTRLTLDFGDMNREEALRHAAKIDRIPMECPGYHVELSGWRRLWQLDKAIEALYDKLSRGAA